MPAVPYPIQPGSFVEVTAEFTLNNQQNISLFHYVYPDNGIITDGADVLQQLLTALADNDQLMDVYGAAVSADAGRIDWYAQWIRPQRYAYTRWSGEKNATGPANALPQNVAVAVTKRGIVANRSGIGTLHMGGVPSAWVLNGKVIQGFSEAYTLLANALPTTIVLGPDLTFDPVLFNRTTPADSQLIAEAFYQDTSRIMRRRTVGLGS